MTPEDYQFLQSIKDYINKSPEVGAYVASYVAQGIDESRKAQAAKSADMEIIISFLLRGGKLKASDKEFIGAKLEKWSKLCSLNWQPMIEEWRK